MGRLTTEGRTMSPDAPKTPTLDEVTSMADLRVAELAAQYDALDCHAPDSSERGTAYQGEMHDIRCEQVMAVLSHPQPNPSDALTKPTLDELSRMVGGRMAEFAAKYDALDPHASDSSERVTALEREVHHLRYARVMASSSHPSQRNGRLSVSLCHRD